MGSKMTVKEFAQMFREVGLHEPRFPAAGA